MTLTATHIQDDPAPDVPDISPVPEGEEPIPVPEPLPPPDAWGPRGLEAV